VSDHRRARILELLALPNESFASVGRLFGISPQRVHQIVDPESYNRTRRRSRSSATYTCRACGKVGHNRRNPDCPKAKK
jgi:hypothetical protein